MTHNRSTPMQPPKPQDVVREIRERLTIHDPGRLMSRLREGETNGIAEHLVTLWGHAAAQTRDESNLMTLAALRHRIEILPHQVNAAIRVLTKMNSRAILADEVGLGKTIEAGIVMKELIARGLAERVLILTPASLVDQWKGEMENKFNEHFVTHDDPDFEGFDAHNRIISSIDTAKLDKHIPDIISQDWDLTIVDEAHYLKNRNTQRYRLMETLFTRFLLMLTATPMQNTLKELFNLIHVVRPGLLGSEQHFQRSFMGDTQGRKLLNARDLQKLLREVMIRNRRTETGLNFPERRVETHRVEATPEEYELHRHLERFIRDHYEGQIALPMITLQREVASSTEALVETLHNMAAGEFLEIGKPFEELIERAESVQANSKADFVVDLLKKMDEKVIVYTQFRRTQERIMNSLLEAGVDAIAYHGSMNSQKKTAALERFRESGQALVCTDSGSEGLNLQFARVLINYDLPWNPMRVEQRIGRVHRIGQETDVMILNMALRDTIEDYVLEVLYEKIRLFEVAIGEMDLILSNMTTSESLDSMIMEVIAGAKSHKDVKKKLENVSKEIGKSKGTAEEIRRFDESIFQEIDLGTTKSAQAPEDEDHEEIQAAIERQRRKRRNGEDETQVVVEEDNEEDETA